MALNHYLPYGHAQQGQMKAIQVVNAIKRLLRQQLLHSSQGMPILLAQK
jgi:hypothetical protein